MFWENFQNKRIKVSKNFRIDAIVVNVSVTGPFMPHLFELIKLYLKTNGKLISR